MKRFQRQRSCGSVGAGRRRISLFAVGLAAILLLTPAALAEKWRANDAASNHDPPRIQVLTAEELPDEDQLLLRARVFDPDGVGVVTVTVVDAEGHALRRLPMTAEGDAYVARLPRSEIDGVLVSYFVEAFDTQGNGPRLSGSSERPYLFRVKGPTRRTGEVDAGGENRAMWFVAGIAFVFAALTGLLMRGSAPPPRVVIPVVEKKAADGKETSAAPIDYQGSVEEIRAKLEDDIFWIELLTPIGNLRKRDVDGALANLSVRAHHHPHYGRRIYGKAQLLQRLDWVRRADCAAIRERWKQIGSNTEEC